MTGRLLAAGIAATVCLVAPAPAATPVGKADYAGSTSQGKSLTVSLRTKSTRVVSRVSIQFRAKRCQLAKKGTRGTIHGRSLRVRSRGVIVKRGSERHKLPATATFSGGTQVETYRLRGRFTSSDRITGTLRITVRVFNRAGFLVDTCTTPRAIRWKADRLGDLTEPDPYDLPR